MTFIKVLGECCCYAECADRCGSCPSDNPELCTSCQYLADHDDHSDCQENTSCAMLGFEIGRAGCGECVVYLAI